jgi:hypothetical protein
MRRENEDRTRPRDASRQVWYRRLAAAALALAAALTPVPARALTIVPTLTGFSADETQVLRTAFATWSDIILDPMTLTLEIERTPLASYTLARSSGFTAGADGRPASARIDVNADVDWFVDQTPLLNEEFVPTGDPRRFEALEGGPADGRFDLFSIVVHELAHALGFSSVFHAFAEHVGTGPDGRKHYEGEHVDAVLAPTSGTHTADDVYRGDLMNPFLVPSERRLPSFIDVSILADAYGYDVHVPEPPPAPVPEPATLLLAAVAAGAARRTARARHRTRR